MRPSWDEYFLRIVDVVAERSTCDRGKPGCVMVRNNRILVTGYAGSPPGFPHCDEEGHELVRIAPYDPTEYKIVDYKEHCVRTIHAEQNAIIQAANEGIRLQGATCYVSMTPCKRCAMFLISVGVKRVVCRKRYHAGEESEKMLERAGIELIHVEEGTMTYGIE